MRWLILCVLVALPVLAEDEVLPSAVTYRFTREDVGKLPSPWKRAQTGEGKGSVWKVVADKTAPSGTGNVLAQQAESPKAMFNLCVADRWSFADVEVTVQFKAVAGKIDQGGGVVWRYIDADNYYVCRYNPLEGNFRVYKVVKGKRIQLATKEDLSLEDGKWHSLSITHVGDKITCSVGGKKYLEVKDDTFSKAGKVGLWTKADAQTYFDDIEIKAK